MNVSEIRDEELLNVVGGVKGSDTEVDITQKFKELKEAAKRLGLELSTHQLEAIADKWEKNGFTLTAEEMLADI